MKARLIAFALAALTGAAQAEQPADYPSRPLRLVVPFAPGGASDNVARQLALKLAAVLKQSVVVDNKPGAAGNIAVDSVARAPADGYTMLVGNVSTNAINPTTYAATLKVNPGKDLVGVSMVATIPHLMVASAKFPPNTIGELVQYAGTHPKEVNHASAGAGSYAMIDMLVFERTAKLDMVHVPYKGGAGPFLTAMVANEVQIAFVNASSALELIRAGRLKALAVTTDKRMPELPNVQTMAEAGFAGIGTNAWQGLFVPADTPKQIVQKLHAAVQQALANPELKDAYAKMTIVPQGSKSPEEFTRFVQADSQKWGTLVKELKVSVEQ